VWWNGLAFFPARHTMTLSEHRLGLWPITSPLIWLGISPIASYNVAFLSSFFLSALAAYALGLTLTGSRSAAFIAGLVFGFNPFRAGHLSHLELLASYWLPVILLALHRWLSSHRFSWLALFAIAMTMQGLTSGYYSLFFGVLVGLWLV
jgi:hypothetical protein